MMNEKEAYLFGEICRINGMVSEALKWKGTPFCENALVEVMKMIQQVSTNAIEKSKPNKNIEMEKTT